VHSACVYVIERAYKPRVPYPDPISRKLKGHPYPVKSKTNKIRSKTFEKCPNLINPMKPNPIP